DAMLRIRYAQVPVVAAMRGLALGGGCELAVHCARRVAHLESYIGLVEVGVGLIPGGGGLAYAARRAAEMANAGNANADIFKFVTDGFTSAAMAKVGTSAIESRKLGYLLWSDVIVPHRDELLFVATQQAKAMFDSGYRPPARALIPVAGRSGIATIKVQLANMRDGGFVSAHDFHISSLIAEVVCGGEVDAGSLVTEEYLMALERKHFCGLLEHPKTQERIMGMLQTGKPVRN
ncbi:MAG: enoyl-CoA hydratase-related protein, partial [Burkholderiaceae bacterium]